jgi:hypothetical protein
MISELMLWGEVEEAGAVEAGADHEQPGEDGPSPDRASP